MKLIKNDILKRDERGFVVTVTAVGRTVVTGAAVEGAAVFGAVTGSMMEFDLADDGFGYAPFKSTNICQ